MPPFTKSDLIWFNGELTRWDDAHINVSAHGLQYGTGVFEGMRSYDTADGPAIFRLDAHMRRFAASASYYEITWPYSFEQLCAASLDVIRANSLDNAYLRPLAFFDSYSFNVLPKGCPVSVAIIAVPGRPYTQGGPERGLRVTISNVRRIDAASLPPFVKACGHYTNSVRAVQDASKRGFDDALLLNYKGDIAEGSGANLFLVKDGRVITNDADASIVLGITRDSVLQIAADLGFRVDVRPITIDDVTTADEAFFTGTAIEVTPITEVDGRAVGEGKTGPITLRIQQTYFDAVHGRLPQYQGWLAYTRQMQTA